MAQSHHLHHALEAKVEKEVREAYLTQLQDLHRLPAEAEVERVAKEARVRGSMGS
jgi:hypothetical protein